MFVPLDKFLRMGRIKTQRIAKGSLLVSGVPFQFIPHSALRQLIVVLAAYRLQKLFDNDESSARPAGSMEVIAVIWWKHNCNNGQYSSAVVHRSLSVAPQDGVTDPKKIEDYSIKLKKLEKLEPKIFNPTNVVLERV